MKTSAFLGVALLAFGLLASSCVMAELKDDPKTIPEGEGVAYLVVESDTRVRKLLFRAENIESSAAIMNMAPGTTVAAFKAKGARYCLFEISTPGMSFTNPDRQGCFELKAGVSKYVGHMRVKNTRVSFAWKPLEGLQAYADAYPKLYNSYPRH